MFDATRCCFLFLVILSLFSSSKSGYCNKDKCWCGVYSIRCTTQLTRDELSRTVNNISNTVKNIALTYQQFEQFDACKLKNLSNLATLNIGFNNLKTYPVNDSSPCVLPATDLILQDNSLNSTVDELFFTTFKRLKRINLSNNNLDRISSSMFKNLQDIVNLDLSYCRINNIEEMAFGGLNKIEVILLSDNEITKIANNIFSPLISLKILQLQSNDIYSIGNKVFQNLSLLTLDLRYNKISNILPGSFKNTKVKALRLLGNPLHCNCVTLYELYLATKEGALYATCSSPKNLKGRNLDELIQYELNICNENRVCEGDHKNIFNNSTLTHKELCSKPLNYLNVVFISMSVLLFIAIVFIVYLWCRLRKLKRSVKLEEIADIPNVVCNDDELRQRGVASSIQTGEVLFVEKNRNGNQDDNIQLTKLKTPRIQRVVFDTKRRFSYDSEVSFDSLGKDNTSADLHGSSNNISLDILGLDKSKR